MSRRRRSFALAALGACLLALGATGALAEPSAAPARADAPSLASRVGAAIEQHLAAESGLAPEDISLPDLARFVAGVPRPDAPVEIEVRGAPRPGASSRASLTVVLRRGSDELRRGVVTVGLASAETKPRAVSSGPRPARGPALVERGEIVRLRVMAGGLRLEAQGKAREDGRLGETIRATNLDSRREVFGRVAADGAIDVGP